MFQTCLSVLRFVMGAIALALLPGWQFLTPSGIKPGNYQRQPAWPPPNAQWKTLDKWHHRNAFNHGERERYEITPLNTYRNFRANIPWRNWSVASKMCRTFYAVTGLIRADARFLYEL